jgi:thiol:disulfide interchange protein
MEYLEPNQFDSLLSSGERALVMFYADWCIFVKDSNQFLSLLLLQSLRAMVTNSMNLRLMMMITHYGTGSQLVLFLH